jgi:hypothetical protein
MVPLTWVELSPCVRVLLCAHPAGAQHSRVCLSAELDCQLCGIAVFSGPSIRWGLAAGSVGPFTGQAAMHQDGTTYTNTAKGSTWEGQEAAACCSKLPSAEQS